jgi:hypothetical protein
MNLTEHEKEILLYLINQEMDGLCGDLGYMELSSLRKKINAIQAAPHPPKTHWKTLS